MKKKTNKNKHLPLNLDVNVLKIKTERSNFGALKTILILFLIALQAAFLILSNLYFIAFFQWFFFISVFLSISTCLYVLSSNKNSQSKPIWIFFLLTCFEFGYIFYFISNEKIFWRNSKKKYCNIINKSSNLLTYNDKLTYKTKEIENDCKYLETAGKFLPHMNNDCKYYSSGSSLFDDIIKELDKAKDFIFMEFYIISDGILLNKILTVLENKVTQGVDVRIIYDDLGSHGTIKRKTKKKIIKSGIKLCSFNKVLPKVSALLNYRDHRKLVIIDGKVVFTGGTNLADEYINEKRLHGYWKDSGVIIIGPAVDNFTISYLRQWEFVTNDKIEYANYLNLSQKTDNHNIVVPFVDGLEYEDNISKNIYCNIISNTKEKLYIMSPYFVIDDTINNLLINKAKSGVDVRIILPEIADKKLVYIISRNNAEKLLKYGIKVYTMRNSFVHSKVLLNDYCAIVGSINMDLRSFYQQFESAIYITDPKVLKEINEDFNDTFIKSKLKTTRNSSRNNMFIRIIAGIINLISPFM